ncbi:hypothetical protein FBUS_01341 [Fasciolopsis buskii]|uniref:NR LBD domain-containing protein n=1 Tax=Fasciolopsis buskii TaxID=27845 RepID=A0A8E0RY26_9TREM|nr:hypothetical protein FBUS_01341 [Fasciolopsis buski]
MLTNTLGSAMGLRKSGTDLVNMDRRFAEPVNATGTQRLNASSTSCSVSSTVTLLSMLTKAYDLVGPSAPTSATTPGTVSSSATGNNSSSSSFSSKLDVEQTGSLVNTRSAIDTDPDRTGVCSNLNDPRSRSPQFQLNRLCTSLQESMVEIRRYAEMVPGFMSLGNSDREVLLKLHCLDLMTLRLALRLHPITQKISDGRNSVTALSNLENSISGEMYPSVAGMTHTWMTKDNSVFIEPCTVMPQPTSLGPIPVYCLENGQTFQYEELYQAGVGGWARQLWETGMQIRALIQGDWSAVAGLAALILINYKSINCESKFSRFDLFVGF